MALTDEGGTGMVMPVAPIGYGNGYGGGYGIPMGYPMMGGGNGFGFGGDLSGLIVLFLFAAMFGFGGNGFGGFGGGFDGAFPWLMTGQAGINANTNAGFDNAAVGSQLSGIHNAVTSGFGDVQLGLAGVNAGIANGFAQAEIGANSRQMANMNQLFGLSKQFSDCCCENRLASADLKYTIATENCADRAAVNDALRDVIANQTAGTQRILDQLCSDKLEQKNDIINQLRSELMYARGQASQDVQTAAIQAGQRSLANEIEQYVLPTPRPAYLVQNPNCCATNVGCGCGTF